MLRAPLASPVVLRLFLSLLLALPRSAYTRTEECQTVGSLSSLEDAAPSMGEALLQHHAKREQRRPDRVVEHAASDRRHNSMMQTSFEGSVGEDGLPPQAKQLFNEQLCKVKPWKQKQRKEANEPPSKTALPKRSPATSDIDEARASGEDTDARGNAEHNAESEATDMRGNSEFNAESQVSAAGGHSEDTEEQGNAERDADTKDLSPKSNLDEARSFQGDAKKQRGNAKSDAAPEAAEEDFETEPEEPSNDFMSEKRSRDAEQREDDRTPDFLEDYKDDSMPRARKSHVQLRQTSASTRPGGFSESFLKWDPEENLASMKAPLNERGFKKIRSLNSESEMKMYLRRVADSCNLKIIDEGGMNGAIGWFNDPNSDTSFDKVKVALFKALLAASKDHWVSVKNVTGVTPETAPLDLVGYVQVRALRKKKAMIKFVRRMVQDMGIKIVDMDGFNGLMAYYSEPDDSESFQKLIGEIRKAAYEHSWAELE